uniref:tRNA (cytosine(38)-C(5))-methyltransferase-like n=1 Tax=Gasterosteus aculeatus aculeatus TaxID=481459 RepID=UPI001A98BAE9
MSPSACTSSCTSPQHARPLGLRVPSACASPHLRVPSACASPRPARPKVFGGQDLTGLVVFMWSQIPEAFPHPAGASPHQHTVVSSPPSAATGRPDEDTQGGHVLYKQETEREAQRKTSQNQDLSVRRIRDFLEPPGDVNMEHYLLPPGTLLRYSLLLDIVQPTCRTSVCFTKGYGRYVEGTGSVLQCCVETEMESVFAGLDQMSEDDKLQQLLKLKLRYFSPREVANLMGFPQSFSFPQQISTKQQYRVLGNSLNVVVVARLLRLLV